MKIKLFLKKMFCKHNYELIRWRLIHWRGRPLTIQAEYKCNKCEKQVVLFGINRNKDWEEKHKHLLTREVF